MNKKAAYNDFKWKPNNKINRQNQVGDLMLNLKIIPNRSKNWKFYAKGMVTYVADHQELLTPQQIETIHQNKNLDAYTNSYLSYMARDSAKKEDDINPNNHIWHYSNLKQYKGQDVSTYKTVAHKGRFELCDLNDVRKIHKKSHIWSIVISEKDLRMKDIMFKNQHQIVDRVIRSMFDFPVDATCAFHGNTEHPHIHIMVYQPENMKEEHIQKRWKIKDNKLAAAKKSYFYFLINNQNYFNKLLNAKSKLKEMYNGEVLQRVMQKQFIELLNVLAKDKQPWLDENGKQKLSKNGVGLFQMKFQYNRLNAASKRKVQELKEYILNLDTNQPDILNFQNQYREFRGVGSKLIEEEFNKLPDKKKLALIEKTNALFDEADEKIYQQLLKTAKEFHLKNYQTLNNQNDDFNSFNNPNNKEELQEIEQNEKQKIIIPPAIHKILVNASAPTMNDMYNSLAFEMNLNGNLTALKKLMYEIEHGKRPII